MHLQPFGSVTFIEWTKFLREDERLAFVTDVLNRYQVVVTDHPGEENTFKLHQMDITLACDPVPGSK